MDNAVKMELVRNMILAIGEDPAREGLLDTPKRVVKAWGELFAGYHMKPEDIATTFDADGYNELVLLKDIEFYSTCVAGFTMVETPKGRMPLFALRSGDWIYSFNEQLKTFEVERCLNPRVTQKDVEVLRVISEKDTLLCTPDHKFLTYDGWVEAKDLRPGTRIISLNKGCIIVCGKARPYLNLAGGQVPEHKVVFESVYHSVADGFDIHHKDETPWNNLPENLIDLDSSEHSRRHAVNDGRGKREARRIKNLSFTERAEFESRRKDGLNKVYEDPIRRAAMLKKRSESVAASWEGRRADKNHKILGVDSFHEKIDVWCLDAPKNHNFVANGMVVHNCEHHMLSFSGKAHVGYIPNGQIIGISKLARILDIYARRLQIQERLGQQVTKALNNLLQPLGTACIIEARHLCMRCRGVEKQQSTMITSSLTGVFLEDTDMGRAARAELMSLIRN
jgi:GTP cyclohydrolase I